MVRIAILTNGGTGIGMGHIMRCLALANEFKLYNCEICFISTVKDGIETIRSFGYTVINPVGDAPAVNSGIAGMENAIYDLFETYPFDLLIIDSYDVTFDFFINLKSRVGKLVYIDDLNAFTYPVDVVINGNANVKELDYQKYTPHEVLLIGTEYNLLRQEFRDLPNRSLDDKVKDILITSGGSDPHNICYKIAEMILSDATLAELQLKIVIGKSFINSAALHELAMCHPAITLYREPESMAKLMFESDLAVSAGGSTLYELCACGVPTLSFIMAENQAGLAEDMDKRGLIKCLGWYDKLTKENLCSNLKDLMSDKNKRTAISGTMREFADGYGTKRVVERIMKIMHD